MRFYVLGSNPALSLAEFFAVYPSATAVATSDTVLVTDEGGPEPKQAVNRLAGVVKSGSVSTTIPSLRGGSQADEAISREVASSVAALLPRNDDGKRIEFGLSLYDGGNASLFGTLKGEANGIGMTVKRALEAEGRKARVVTMKADALSSVAVTTQATSGDICLIATKDGILAGRTEAVQDFEAWSKRDFGRPSRDAKSGMLPPKLARLMVNLSGVQPEGSAILDPFCGSGTILMEAALMGSKAVIGSDISKKAVADTGRNMEWMRHAFPDTKKVRVSVYETPAEKVDAFVKETVDAIVTETFLGPPLRREANAAAIRKSVNDLMRIVEPSLKAMAGVLKPDGKMVIAFPAFRVGRAFAKLPVEPVIKAIGFSIADRFLYERPGQRVGRDIVVLTR
ncbi:hypothetical protein A2856_01330 [Candidatus Uhrbacteria bacterium RIFCSPHIGHO2_01_FULL_63_20]|uniref:Ribosomal RNA large subunit methyltransferase K/L-like methyltransferase domain-containing protein n=1 Tax=Candidatus Uhrbacteria bacterium RIFCSPHIGHO2_01_FULL_63_20 TaxID=1802385 RepID=A0A1F7TMX2_9BACT|nr:MAG: hypothetical protein A2856_01330 [Candidatus Uhrbacteria bacterium RIFCSPHIGHO2_01_FULL_63_20]